MKLKCRSRVPGWGRGCRSALTGKSLSRTKAKPLPLRLQAGGCKRERERDRPFQFGGVSFRCDSVSCAGEKRRRAPQAPIASRDFTWSSFPIPPQTAVPAGVDDARWHFRILFDFSTIMILFWKYTIWWVPLDCIFRLRLRCLE